MTLGYPRPQLERNSFQSLNGLWDFKIEKDEKIMEEGRINVPYSPEAEESGVNHTLMPDEILTYKTHVKFNSSFDGSREKILLHFGAVDYNAIIFIDGENKLSHHGGYLPFYLELDKSEFDLCVVVTDSTDTSEIARGKQSLKPKGIWYPSSSGIWQEVWLEKVPFNYIENIKLDPDLNGFDILIKTNNGKSEDALIIFDNAEYKIKTDTSFRINIKEPKLWSPEDPYLYHFAIKTSSDYVKSYVGLRTFEVKFDENGIKRLFLNGKKYYHHGLLDQGYYYKGLYTPLSEEEMVSDLIRAKELGFNTIRKHIKVEPLRWYYYADTLGLLVWQDMVSGGGKYKVPIISFPLFIGSFLKDNHYFLFSRRNKKEREDWILESLEMVRHLYNVTSICMWVPFNEGWGQFDSSSFLKTLLSFDKSRTIDITSGWHDQKDGEFKSLHIYFKKYKYKKDKLDRCVILSEFGGYGLVSKKYLKTDKSFVYKNFKTKEDLTDAIVKLYENEIIKAKNKGLSGSIYTELTDVEGELNGLISYDRKEFKIIPEKIKKMSEELLKD